MKIPEMMFYRCMMCSKVVNQKEILRGEGCPNCAGGKVRPTNLSLLEKIVQICKNPRVWRWKNEI